MRIASICPSNTEMLAYLGIADKIVGTDNFSDWPKQVRELPKLGPDLDINMDALEELKPDLVVASLTVPGMEKNIERLQDRNMPYIVLNPTSLSDIAANLVALGAACGVSQKGKEAAAEFQQTIADYKAKSERVAKRPDIYWEWWPKPVYSPGGANWLTEISSLAGGRNLFADQPEKSVQTDWEQVAQRNPDIICLAWVGVLHSKVKPEAVLSRPGWNEIKAVRSGQIHVMEESLFCRPSPRLLEGLKKLASLLES